MNKLTTEMKRSLRELDLGLRGVLTMTPEMENLSNSLFTGTWNITKTDPYYSLKLKVPSNWTKLAYASLNGLSAWYW